MNIEKIDRKTLAVLTAEIDKALEQVAAKFGLIYERKAGSFSEHEFNGKFQMNVAGEDGLPASAKQDFELFAPQVGLDLDMFGATYVDGGHTYKVIGINHKAPKNCVELQREDGKRFKCPPEYLRSKLGK